MSGYNRFESMSTGENSHRRTQERIRELLQNNDDVSIERALDLIESYLREAGSELDTLVRNSYTQILIDHGRKSDDLK